MRRTLLLASLCCVVAAWARDEPGVALPKPIILRLQGHFAPNRERAQAAAPDALEIAIDDVHRWLAVDRAQTIGDHPLDGRDVLAALAPVRPHLNVVGSDELRRRLREQPDGMPIEMEGLVSRGARTFLLRRVVIGSDAE